MNILLDTLMNMLEHHQKLRQRALTEHEYNQICGQMHLDKQKSSMLAKEMEKEGLIERYRRKTHTDIIIKHHHGQQIPDS